MVAINHRCMEDGSDYRSVYMKLRGAHQRCARAKHGLNVNSKKCVHVQSGSSLSFLSQCYSLNGFWPRFSPFLWIASWFSQGFFNPVLGPFTPFSPIWSFLERLELGPFWTGFKRFLFKTRPSLFKPSSAPFKGPLLWNRGVTGFFRVLYLRTIHWLIFSEALE